MGYYEDKRDLRVLPAFKKRGAPMFLKSKASTFNSVTGGMTVGATVLQAVYGLVLSKSNIEKGRGSDSDTEIKGQKLAVMISATGVSTPPSTDMWLVMSGIDYEILSVAPLAPGGVDVLYELAVRL